MEDLTGKQFGPYQVVAPLGEGGMAAVYKAYQPGMDRYVALKILPRHFASDPLFVSRFEQEAKVLAKLQHPHILPVFDFGQADGYTYIVMPFLQSSDLTTLVRTQTLSLTQIRLIISQVGDALDYAHSRGLVHRDVKPSNVLLDERGNCLLTDFGIAKIVENSSKLTATGGIIGTPAYMAPEQGMGEPVDGRSDIYALGIMLYEMAIGRVPYQAETPMAVMIKHLNDPLPLPRHLNPALPEAVERVILKALAKNPQDRYATAGEMVRALQAAIPETIEQPPLSAESDATLISTSGATLKEQRQKHAGTEEGREASQPPSRWLGLAVGLVILVLVAAGVIFFAFRSSDEQASEPTAAATAQTVAAVQPTEPTIEQAATEATSPVETPAPAPPAPAAGLYDDFAAPAFDGTWNPALWESDSDEPCQVAQQEGVIKFEAPAQAEATSCALGLNQPNLVSAEQLGTIEARLQIADDFSGEQINMGIGLGSEDLSDGDWFAFCGLTAHPNETEAYFEVANYGAGSTPDISQGVPADLDRWYTFRLEITPDPLTFACFVDDSLIGSVTPADAPALGQARFHRSLDSYRETKSSATTYADDIRLSNGVETRPQAYDSFDSPAFEGRFNPDLWEPWEDIDTCEAVQEDDALRLSCTQPDGSGLNALRYQEVEFGQIGFVEARLKLDSDISAEQGAVSVLLTNSLESWAGCGLAGNTDIDQAQLSCNVASFRNDTFTEEYRAEGPALDYDTWHTVRIEMDPESGELTFFADGQPIGTHTPDEIEQWKTVQFNAELQLYLEDGSLVTGYFDDVRIGLVE